MYSIGQFIAGVFLFIVPGMLPAYVRYKDTGKDGRLSAGVAVLLYDFLILVCTGGIVYLLFGDVIFSIKYYPYVLLYVFWLVGAYGFSFVLGVVNGLRRPGAFRGCGRAAVLIGSALWVLFMAGLFYDDYAKRHIVINEVCAHNLSLSLDDAGENSDYIELYNPSYTLVPLDGFCLTDQGEVQEAHRLSGINIAPRSYLLLFANGAAKTEQTEEEGEAFIHLGFRIREKGETLTLFDRGGAV
ncbi:MAG: lamin tail domain-containing protein, partial [Lachnospiraceae bacterium]|nr:lamin tail domain-containing protein [Lachnospiraceae bacterium]